MLAYSNWETLFDYASKKNRIKEIETLMGESGFWDDNEAAQRVVSELKGLKTVVSPMNDLTDSVGDLEVLFEMAEEDSSVQEEVEAELKRLEELLEVVGRWE